MSPNKLSIFIAHPSDLLTDCQPHGDGLVSFGFISQLAQRGHDLHVAVASTDIRRKLPENVKLYPTKVLETARSPIKSLEYMTKVRQILNQICQDCAVDVIHQLNPVHSGLSLSLTGIGLPVVLGPFPAYWPHSTESKFKFSIKESISSSFKSCLKHISSYQQQQQAMALLVSTPAALSRLYKPESSKHKIYTLSPGIDSTFFSPTSPDELSKSKEVLNILFLANLGYHKGIFTLLDAFELVVAALPSCRLTIAGSGPALNEVRQRISIMSCQSNISLIGNVERANVPELMRQCTLYCLPSYGESFGMSALEAMACGKPVVATNAGGLAYLVPDQGGYKVPPKDAQALANALLEILCSPKLQVEMGLYNRNLVEETYSWERVAEQLESVYYKLIASTN